jgi:hypothetical protein
MCMSAYAQYHPRPVHDDPVQRPESAPVTSAEADTNLFGPKPTPPAWVEHDRDHKTTPIPNGIASITGGRTKDAGGVIVELSDGTRLLICPV